MKLPRTARTFETCASDGTLVDVNTFLHTSYRRCTAGADDIAMRTPPPPPPLSPHLPTCLQTLKPKTHTPPHASLILTNRNHNLVLPTITTRPTAPSLPSPRSPAPTIAVLGARPRGDGEAAPGGRLEREDTPCDGGADGKTNARWWRRREDKCREQEGDAMTGSCGIEECEIGSNGVDGMKMSQELGPAFQTDKREYF
jgi:hypothetical protein